MLRLERRDQRRRINGAPSLKTAKPQLSWRGARPFRVAVQWLEGECREQIPKEPRGHLKALSGTVPCYAAKRYGASRDGCVSGQQGTGYLRRYCLGRTALRLVR